MTIIDDFSDGDITVSADDWSGWNRDTAGLSASSTSYAEGPSGSPEGALAAGNRVYTTHDSGIEPDKFRFYFYKPTRESTDFTILDHTYSYGILELYIEGDGEVTTRYSESPLGTWYAGDPYQVTLTFDWLAETFDVEVYNLSTGNVDASGSEFDFESTGYSLGAFEVNTYIDTTYFDDVQTLSPPTAPTNLSVDATRSTEIDLSWTDADNENEYNVLRSQSSGSTAGDYTTVATLPGDSTTYTDSGLDPVTTYYYRVEAANSIGSELSNEASGTTEAAVPTQPQNVSLTVDANDQVTLSWDEVSDWGGETGSYEIEMSRNGASYVAPTGGPTNVSGGSASYSKVYGPNSDQPYETVIGIDSSFQFRVRATNSAGSSSWVETGTGYTDPIPPHNPSVSRPDGDTFEIDADLSVPDRLTHIEVQTREDSGGDYGAWDGDVYATSDWPLTLSVGDTIGGITIQKDARYQFRIASRDTAPSVNVSSEWVYADYGNEGNVFFEDNFEDQDLSEWTTTLNDSDSGITSGSLSQVGIPGADEGTYYVRLDSGDYIYKQLGDLNGESDVIVKATMAAGSLDSGQHFDIKWYDGSSWGQLDPLYWEYNQQGWVEMAVLVPADKLSSNNFVQFHADGSGTIGAVDRVVVSDILHEYSTPAAQSNQTLDATAEDELTVDATENAAFNDGYNVSEKRSSDSSWPNSKSGTGYRIPLPSTISPVDDGEEYDVRVRAMVDQYRHGSLGSTFYQDGVITSAVAILPAPTDLLVNDVMNDTVDLSWTNNHDYGSVAVQYKRSSNSTWQDWATGLSRSTENETLTGLLDGEKYDARVLAVTEHAQTEDV